MIDWALAQRIAGRVAGEGSVTPLPGDLDAICIDARERVVAYSQMTPVAPMPSPESVSRAGWIAANLMSMRTMLDPVVDRLPVRGTATNPVRLAGEVVLTAEAGAVTGYLGRRVLGQYDLALLDPSVAPRLLFVAPNIGQAAGSLRADSNELLRWIAFHEVTHAVQFTSVPWLREHLGGMLRGLLEVLDVEMTAGRLLRMPTTADARGVVDRVRTRSLIGLLAGPEQLATLERVQATMALVEGHAEHVMDAAGADALPSLARLRASIDHRRAHRPPVLRLVEKLLGMELKMRQYIVGKRFCDQVVAARGIEGLNVAWSAPELVPTMAELEQPRMWLARV